MPRCWTTTISGARTPLPSSLVCTGTIISTGSMWCGQLVSLLTKIYLLYGDRMSQLPFISNLLLVSFKINTSQNETEYCAVTFTCENGTYRYSTCASNSASTGQNCYWNQWDVKTCLSRGNNKQNWSTWSVFPSTKVEWCKLTMLIIQEKHPPAQHMKMLHESRSLFVKTHHYLSHS